MLTIRPPAFVETGGCDGPKYIRGQPSRENNGVIITDIQDKYIAEFSLPYRNVDRYIKEVKNSWDRLDPEQRKTIKQSLDEMSADIKEGFSEETPDGSVTCAMQYILQDPKNISNILDISWKPTKDQQKTHGMSKEDTDSMRLSINKWSTDNYMALNTNWVSGVWSFLIILLFLVIGIAIGSSVT